METLKKIGTFILTLLIALITLRFLRGGDNQGKAMEELNKAKSEALKLKGEYDSLEGQVQELKKEEIKGTTKGAEDYWKGKYE